MSPAAPLACPMCGRALACADDRRVWRCGDGHAFDVARQGYVNLLRQGAADGDSAAMVGARERFLARGLFAPVARAVAVAANGAARERELGGAIVELGAGTGWYLAQFLDSIGGEGVGAALDSSVAAARRAARAHPRVQSVVADVWGVLPLLDSSAAVVLGVFAPRNGAETARVLAPGGVAVIVTPTPRHLAELRQPLGLLEVEPAKEERLARSMAPLASIGSDRVEFVMNLNATAIAELVGMGPTARHVGSEEMASRIAALGDAVPVTASVTVHRYGNDGE